MPRNLMIAGFALTLAACGEGQSAASPGAEPSPSPETAPTASVDAATAPPTGAAPAASPVEEEPAAAGPARLGPRLARCVIGGGTMPYEGPCRFNATSDGSFSIDPPQGRTWLGGGVSTITVGVVSPGVAQVRGLTEQGVASLWGEARRSTADPACWDGPDFRICAY